MHHFGLDFGTNYISASYVNPASGKPEPVRFMDNGQEKMPALVYYSEHGVLVGQGVQSMLEQLSTFPPRERLQTQQAIVRSLKRGMNPSGVHIASGKGAVSHVDVVTDIMAFVKQDVEAGCFAGEKAEKLTLTHPVVCTEAYKGLLKTAAEKAGFKQVNLMEEPVAAAMGYASSGIDVGRGILVYDFGGGTFDVAFVMRDDNGQFHIPLSPLGDPWCGGDDLDMRLYEYWDRKAQEEKGRSINGSAGEIDAGFLFRCRRHKETLSRMEKMAFTEYLPPQDGALNPEENKLTVTLDRNIAKQLFMADVGRTIDITKRMLSNVEDAGHKVDTVILIGGSSRLPMLKELLKDILPVKPLETMNVDVAVAMGAVWKEYPKPHPKSKPYPEPKPQPRPEPQPEPKPKLPVNEQQKYYKMAVNALTRDDYYNAAQYMLRASRLGHPDAIEWVAKENPRQKIEAENLYQFGLNYSRDGSRLGLSLAKPKMKEAAKLGHPKAKTWLQENQKERITVTEPSSKPSKSIFSRLKDAVPTIAAGFGLENLAKSAGMTWKEPITGMEFIAVPGGEYDMGDIWYDFDSDEPIHRVKISDFWMGKYPVIQNEWETVMDSNPSRFKKGGRYSNSSRFEKRYPVEGVSWHDAQKFLRHLNDQSEGSVIFRLPTEAEWEYAARSCGKKERFSGSNNIDEVAWYGDNSGLRTHPVGVKKSNALGLHDMSGNVWEWCQDMYRYSGYNDHSFENPVCIYTSEDPEDFPRILRGGSCTSCWTKCTSPERYDNNPFNRNGIFGVRIAFSHGLTGL